MNFGLPCLHFEYMQLYLSQQFVIVQQLSQPGDFVGFAIIRLEHMATDNLVFYHQGITVCVIMKICCKKVIFFFFLRNTTLRYIPKKTKSTLTYLQLLLDYISCFKKVHQVIFQCYFSFFLHKNLASKILGEITTFLSDWMKNKIYADKNFHCTYTPFPKLCYIGLKTLFKQSAVLMMFWLVGTVFKRYSLDKSFSLIVSS